ncbi:MAG: hypothetical protein DRN15_07095 [Thermoprotei archaeon]|nr:MAG: hypothetical protein DRN15_07095 [Thermoprotei archaeon]
MRILYVYDSSIEDEYRNEIRQLLDKVKKLGVKVEEIDMAGWSDEEKSKFYLERLAPISVIRKKRLRGRIRTHKAGLIMFHDMIIVNSSDFFIGEEAVRWLRAFLLRAGG